MDVIEISRLRVHTEVGFSPHELGKLQELVISIHLKTSKKAGQTDRVEDTINYKTIGKDVLFHVQNKKYKLIEAVAEDIARISVVRHDVPWVKVLVQKPNSLRFSDCSSVTIERRWEDFDLEEVHVSIGSNINPLQNIPKAIGLLKAKVQLTKLSKAFRTTPVGFKEQEDFINIAAVLRTKLDPTGLKQVLTNIEQQLGRIRDPNNKNAARTIDLDISFWGDTTLEYRMNIKSINRTWSIPDPDTLKHAHVIIPLADVTPEFIHPMENKHLRMIAIEVSGVEDFISFFPIVEISEMGKDDLSVSSCSNTAAIGKSLNGLPQLNVFSTEHPVALITGAAKRLGACIARRLHAVGYDICLHYNTSKVEATSLFQEFNSLRINSARLIQADLSSDTQYTAERIIRESLEIWGQLDVLVNNASQFYPTEVGQIRERDWNDMMQTNLCAPFFLSQAAFPNLKASQGCIVNLLDIHADRPLINHSLYCISKAGLQMCTLALAKDFAPYVRVNGVSPGAILWAEKKRGGDSAATGASADELRKKETLKKIPMGRKGDPSQVASTVEFLVRDAAYITGQVINVDGGRTLNQ